MDCLAMILRHFDVVAIQEVRATDQDVIPRLVDHVNATGRQYDYIVGPRVGRPGTIEQYAYLFDRATVEADRHQLYTVKDPDDLLHWEPLVGWFRAIGPPKQEAYTFTLVNVRVDPENVQQELNVLDDVFRAVRNDGREEDDVILLGDFQRDARQLGPLTLVGGMTRATTGIPTNTQGTEQLDNLLFQGHATREFTGRAGVFDFMRRFNFTMNEALEISDHLPVWAEFSVREGGQPGRTAQSDSPTAQY
jgi:exonuclease III